VGLHSALVLLERWSTFLRNPALITDPPEGLSIIVLFKGALGKFGAFRVVFPIPFLARNYIQF
jgi:hypothetical protein